MLTKVSNSHSDSGTNSLETITDQEGNSTSKLRTLRSSVAANNSSTCIETEGDFTFWISLSLSLFAQSKIRTERKLNQKVKLIFLFGLS